MSFFSHVGAQALKYQIALHDIEFRLSAPDKQNAECAIKWTRGPKIVKTDRIKAAVEPAAKPPGNKEALLYAWPKGKPLVLIATLYKKGSKFQKKLCKVSVKRYVNNKEDSGGSVELDLADFVSLTELSQTKEFTKLSKAPDKKAVLKFTVKSKWLKELKAGDKDDDTASVMSGMSTAGSVDHSKAEPVGAPGGDVKDLEGLSDDDEAADEKSKGLAAGSGAAVAAAAAAAAQSANAFAKTPTPVPAAGAGAGAAKPADAKPPAPAAVAAASASPAKPTPASTTAPAPAPVAAPAVTPSDPASHIAALEQQLTALNAQLHTVKEQAATKNKANLDFITTLNATIKKLKDEKAAGGAGGAAAPATDASAAAAPAGPTAAELAAATAATAAATAALNELKAKHAHDLSVAAVTADELKLARDRARAEVDELQKLLAKRNGELDVRDAELAAARDEKTKAAVKWKLTEQDSVAQAKTLADTQQRLTEADARTAQLTAALAAAQTAVAERDTRLQGLQEKAEADRARAAKERADSDARRAGELQAAAMREAEWKRKAESSAKDAADARVALQSRDGELKDVTAQLAAFKTGQSADAQARDAQRAKELQAVRAAEADARQKLAAAELAQNALKAQLADADRAKTELQRALQDAEARATAAAKERDAAAAEATKARAEAAAATAAAAAAQTEAAAERTRLQTALTAAQAELAATTRAHQALVASSGAEAERARERERELERAHDKQREADNAAREKLREEVSGLQMKLRVSEEIARDKDAQLTRAEHAKTEAETALAAALAAAAAKDKALTEAKTKQADDYKLFQLQASKYESDRSAERDKWKARERDLSSRLERTAKELNESKWAISAAKSDAADAKSKLDAALKKEEASKQGASAVQKQAAEREAERERDFQALRAKEAAARQRVGELETQLTAANRNADENAKEVSEWGKRHAEWLAREQSYQAQLTALRTDAAGERDALAKQVESLSTERVAARRATIAQADTTRTELAAALKKISSLQAAADAAREKESEREAAREKERDALHTENERLQRREKELTAQLAAASAAAAAAAADKSPQTPVSPSSPQSTPAAAAALPAAAGAATAGAAGGKSAEQQREEDEREEAAWIAKQKEKKAKRKAEQKKADEERAQTERKIASLTEQLEETLLLVKRLEIEKANRATEMSALQQKLADVTAAAAAAGGGAGSGGSGGGAPGGVATATATALALTQLQHELDEAHKQRDEAQRTMAELKAKADRRSEEWAEMSRKLTAADAQIRQLTSDAAQHATALSTVTKQLAQAQAQLKAEQQGSSSVIDTLRTENERLRKRSAGFESLAKSMSDASAKAVASKAIDAKTKADFDRVIAFLDDQLKEADETLVATKHTWLQTGAVLQKQVQELTDELNATKKQMLELSQGKGQANVLSSGLEQKLAKSEAARDKLSELMARFEVELVQKKVQAANALDQVNDLEFAKLQLTQQVAQLQADLAKYKPAAGNVLAAPAQPNKKP